MPANSYHSRLIKHLQTACYTLSPKKALPRATLPRTLSVRTMVISVVRIRTGRLPEDLLHLPIVTRILQISRLLGLRLRGTADGHQLGPPVKCRCLVQEPSHGFAMIGCHHSRHLGIDLRKRRGIEIG